MKTICRNVGLGFLMLAAFSVPGNAYDTGLLFKEVLVREDTDQPWAIVITGEVPSLAGCYIIVHDSLGRLITMHHVPSGRYPQDEPLRIEIPEDGSVGDHRLLLVGKQKDIMGMRLPLTTLPFEVYKSDIFAARGIPPLWFQVSPRDEQLSLATNTGTLRVKDGKETILEIKGEEISLGASEQGPLQVGKLYQLDTNDTFYFKATPHAYLGLDPERWFLPSSDLEQVGWWRLTAPPENQLQEPVE